MDSWKQNKMSLAPLIVAQDNGNCSKTATHIPVVDPVTRKLLIPRESVTVTRAQQRPTIPSLCQLYLQGRCRQDSNCHQVHADVKVVKLLRSQVGRLPNCCAEHGDEDHAGVMNEGSWLSNVFLHVPKSTYEGGYIPLRRVGYTIPVSKLINELPQELYSAVDCYRQKIISGFKPNELPPRVVLEADDISICRLHVTDRCRYAEECNYLHICKFIAKQDSSLQLGRRSRAKSLHKTPSYVVTDSERPHTILSIASATASYTSAPPLRLPPSVRGFPLMRHPISGPSHTNKHYPFALDATGGNSMATTFTALRDMTVPKEMVTVSHEHSFCTPGDAMAFAEIEISKKKTPALSQRGSRSPPIWEPAVDHVMESASELLSQRDAFLHSPHSVPASHSELFGLLGSDEGSSSVLSHSRSRPPGRTWRHDPYTFHPLGVVKGG